PVFEAVETSVGEQTATIEELARSANETSRFVAGVTGDATQIAQTAASAAESAADADHAGQDAVLTAERLKGRFVMLLRQTEFGDRRRDDRLPCDVPVVLNGDSGALRGKTVDLSRGGVLVRMAAPEATAIGATIELGLVGIGECTARLVNRSDLGLHFEFMEMTEAARVA